MMMMNDGRVWFLRNFGSKKLIACLMYEGKSISKIQMDIELKQIRVLI
jgi:hypothetical protein